MKFIDEFRSSDLAQTLLKKIAGVNDSNKHYRLMEFCGGHTHVIFRHALQQLLPDNIEFIHGPGCPVCVLPIARLDKALALAAQPDVIFCSYGDMLRVPASHKRSLFSARAQGADVRVVYSPLDALALAEKETSKHVIFFAVGFETTTPATAFVIQQAKEKQLRNFSVYCNHVLTPAAIEAILVSELQDSENGRVNDATEKVSPVLIDGFLGPSHVSTIIGSAAYEKICERYKKPVVITGFEPLDVLQAVAMLLDQINKGEWRVLNEYHRAVSAQGNAKAQLLTQAIFTLRDKFEWRGLGFIPDSALRIKDEYKVFDAEQVFSVDVVPSREYKGCECPAVLRGAIKPLDCKLFGKPCTPENPLGSCMVSSEGACSAYWHYARSAVSHA